MVLHLTNERLLLLWLDRTPLSTTKAAKNRNCAAISATETRCHNSERTEWGKSFSVKIGIEGLESRNYAPYYLKMRGKDTESAQQH